MASVLSYYKATTNSRGYIYYLADGSTGGKQYEKGTEVHFPTDYASRESNSRWPVIYPMEGWMNKAFFGTPEAVYEEVGADAPTFVFPSSGATTESKTPVVAVKTPSGSGMSLQRKVGSGSWTTVKSSVGGNTTVYDKLPSLSTGTTLVRYRVREGNVGGDEAVISIVVKSASWKRTISSGTVISDVTVSHRADINEMLASVNTQRKFYGLSAISLPGTVGKFADWKMQMDTLVNAVNQSLSKAQQTQIVLTVPSYPTASTINSIRTACRSV